MWRLQMSFWAPLFADSLSKWKQSLDPLLKRWLCAGRMQRMVMMAARWRLWVRLTALIAEATAWVSIRWGWVCAMKRFPRGSVTASLFTEL